MKRMKRAQRAQSVEIRVQERLDPAWAEWLEGFTLEYCGDNETVIRGVAADQAALYGLIARLRDLGVKLISVNYGAPTEDGP